METKERLNKQILLALEKATAKLKFKEERVEQITMCQFLHRYLNYAGNPGHVALVEAGTGVGKSYGYLIAICEWLKGQEDKKVVIATNTISLQEQLTNKDIPQIESLYPSLKIAKAKGRNNYVCLRKLYDPEGNILFGKEDDKQQELIEWLNSTEGENGDRSDVTFPINNKEWAVYSSDKVDCYGATCAHHKKCYYNKSQVKLKKADIIITTHALVLANYVVGGGLPDYTHLVLDEAHNFDKNATSILTTQINRAKIQHLINMSNNKHCKKIFNKNNSTKKINEWRHTTTSLSELFFNELAEGRYLEAKENQYSSMLLQSLQQMVSICNKAIEVKDIQPLDKAALINLSREAEKLFSELNTWLEQSNSEETVYWVENNTACYVPIDIGNMLIPLWSKKNSILTSATLCVAKRFDSIKTNLRLPYKQTYCCRLESPFNYKENGLVYLPSQAVSPKSNGYLEYVTNTTIDILEKTQGKTFILFTSYSMLREVAAKLTLHLGNKVMILEQGTDNRERLLKAYRENENAVLLGTNTYWEGVDEEINCVILTKLPFAVPTTPVEEARYESIKRKGLNPFTTYSLPQCALKMKQGTGRLIRRQGKKGVVVICDPRINNNWGKQIIQTLPDMRWTQDTSLLDEYLPQIS